MNYEIAYKHWKTRAAQLLGNRSAKTAAFGQTPPKCRGAQIEFRKGSEALFARGLCTECLGYKHDCPFGSETWAESDP